jgi:simple sugar transport system ATP-binding protein
MVAIARALSVQASVLILDEPTSSLDDDEVQRLFTVLRRLRDDGLAILFVTHFLEQVYALSDRITVLRNGEWVGEYLARDLPTPALIAAMVGRELAARRAAAAPLPQHDATQPLYELRGLALQGRDAADRPERARRRGAGPGRPARLRAARSWRRCCSA